MIDWSNISLFFLSPLPTAHTAEVDVYGCFSRFYVGLLMLFYELASAMRTHFNHNKFTPTGNPNTTTLNEQL
jgi:hypothetical protein